MKIYRFLTTQNDFNWNLCVFGRNLILVYTDFETVVNGGDRNTQVSESLIYYVSICKFSNKIVNP